MKRWMMKSKSAFILFAASVANLLFAGHLLQDALGRLAQRKRFFIFDELWGGTPKFIPALLAFSMIWASLRMLRHRTNGGLLHAYINAFLFLLFYTPSVFYSGSSEGYPVWWLIFQFAMMLVLIFLLYITREPVLELMDSRPDYTRGVQQYVPEDRPLHPLPNSPKPNFSFKGNERTKG
ncbi:hypothetical protein ABB02_01498 [Clostridiaceae bacterium JG1575]|nr:hypothetical protein ABB02_01498 [Clostridiaceae bacterium JG1575]